ncbi:MAG: hypothetical protein HY049_20225 [Acidobacteria bacterium]|nr:hypothetical protein [Acidobacteriota bacterium]
MRRSMWIPALVAALSLGGGLLKAADKASVSGEVIDSACYVKSGSHGSEHSGCAGGCAKRGVPLALLTDDGKVVMVASAKDDETANALLIEHVAKKVTVEGSWYERGGAKVFYIEKVTPSK